MKFRYQFPGKALCTLFLLFSFAGPMMAQGGKIEVSVAALSLPGSSTGELHWNSGEEYVTQPLQLSKRYFSKPAETKSNVIRFFEEPITEILPDVPLPKPLLTVTLPTGIKEAFVVIFGRGGSQSEPVWSHLAIDGKHWEAGTLRVVNVSEGEIGMIYPDERLKLQPGKHVEFKESDWGEPFPIKIVQFEPVAKLVFSSTWRVSEGRREICFLSRKGNSVSLRSLLVLNRP